MSFLLDFINALSPEEVAKLKGMETTSRERVVLDAYTQPANTAPLDETKLPEKLGLSKSHFDKINSQLLDKAVHFIGGDVMEERFYFLLRRQLFRLLLHEMKLTEKEVKKNGNPQQLIAFYKLAYEMVARFNFNDLDLELLDYYVRNWIKALPASEAEQKLIPRIRQNETLARYYRLRPGSEKHTKACVAYMQKVKDEVLSNNWPEAKMWLYMALSACYEGGEPEKALEYLKLADEASQPLKHLLDEKQKTFILVMQAHFLLALSRYSEALVYYRRTLQDHSALMKSNMYHTYNTAFTLLIEKRYDEAKEVMEQYLQHFLDNQNASNYHFDILRLYVIYDLLTNNISSAGQYVTKLAQFDKSKFTPFGDCLWRFVNNVYIAQSGDYVLATSLAKKNLKFVYSIMDIPGFEPWKRIFLALGNVIRIKSNLPSNKNAVTVADLSDIGGTTRLFVVMLENLLGERQVAN